jgi:hypothetical protein
LRRPCRARGSLLGLGSVAQTAHRLSARVPACSPPVRDYLPRALASMVTCAAGGCPVSFKGPAAAGRGASIGFCCECGCQQDSILPTAVGAGASVGWSSHQKQPQASVTRYRVLPGPFVYGGSASTLATGTGTAFIGATGETLAVRGFAQAQSIAKACRRTVVLLTMSASGQLSA